MVTLKLKNWIRIGLGLALALTSAGCGPHKKDPDHRTLSQKSEDLGDAGYYLCRENFDYVIQQSGSQQTVTSHSFLLAATAEGRTAAKKQILEDCTNPAVVTDKIESVACTNPGYLSSISCVHENYLATPFTPPTGKGVVCTLDFTYAYEGRQLADYTGKFVSPLLTSVSLAVRDIIEQCVDSKLPGVQRDGCSRALLDGKLVCEAK